MSDRGFSILVVCTGNVNRSALAAVLLRTWADWYLPRDLAASVDVRSAGFGAPAGDPMRPRVLRIAEALGADGSAHRARRITDDQIRQADLILTASSRQRETVLQRVPGALRNTFTIREAGRIAEKLTAAGGIRSTSQLKNIVEELAARRGTESVAGEAEADDIVDPEGLDDETFRLMARQEVPAVAHLGALLFGMPRGDLVAYLAAPEERDLLRGAE